MSSSSVIDATAPAEGCVHQNSNSPARESHETGQRKIRQLAGNDLITIESRKDRGRLNRPVQLRDPLTYAT